MEQNNVELAALLEIGGELTSTLDLGEVLRGVVRHSRRLLRGKMSSLLLETQGRWETAATDGAGPAYVARENLDVDDSLVGRVFRTGVPAVIDDVREAPGFQSGVVAELEGLVALLSVPLRSRERVIGVLNVYSGEKRSFGTREIGLLTLLAQQSVIAIKNAELYRQAREAREHLRESEKLAALGRLSAGFAHELRNPLNTLHLLAYAMAEPARGDAIAADLEIVRSEIRRMTLLLDQFLDFARPATPRFARQRVDEILEETLLLIRPETAKRQIAVERAWTGERPAVWADGDQLKQVFLNLVLNAIQAMSPGGRLRVRGGPTPGGVSVAIEDDGPGIPDAIRDRLFEPFFTTREGGTGLGLSVALRIVEAHSGDLRIESPGDRGTTATVWLPA